MEDTDKIKAVVMDVDGTLMAARKNILPYTATMLRRLHENGIIIGIATGRDVENVDDLCEGWGISGIIDVIIGSGGGVISDKILGTRVQLYPPAPFTPESPGEYMAPDVSKTNGIARAMGDLGISMDEVCAFGDQENDCGMLKACGIGVAMGNADETVKAAADYVTDDNLNDGIGKFISRYLLYDDEI